MGKHLIVLASDSLFFVQAFNLPLEIAAIVGGIYRLIDVGSTTVNCMGDLVGTTSIAHTERGVSDSGEAAVVTSYTESS